MNEAINVMEYYKETLDALFSRKAQSENPFKTICDYLALHGATSRTDLINGLSGSFGRDALDKLLQKLVRQGIITCKQQPAKRGRFPHFYELAATQD